MIFFLQNTCTCIPTHNAIAYHKCNRQPWEVEKKWFSDEKRHPKGSPKMVFLLYKDTFVWFGFCNINPSPWDKKRFFICWKLYVFYSDDHLYIFDFHFDFTAFRSVVTQHKYDLWSWSWRRRFVQTLRRQNKKYLKFVRYNFMIQLCFVQNYKI